MQPLCGCSPTTWATRSLRTTTRVGDAAVSYHFVTGSSEVHTTPFRYVWPSELDLMARLAGMTLRDRWAGWDRSTFTGESTAHVSVWQKAADTCR